jgi:glycine cleavage system regulatory protein
MLYHLKIFCLDADETDAPLVREVEPASESRCNWTSSIALSRALADSVLIVRIRASWSSRG